MTASMLNTYPLNGTPRYAYAYSASEASAQALSSYVRLAKFDSSSYAEITAKSSRYAYLDAACKTEALAKANPVDGWRITSASLPSANAEAVQVSIAYKNACMESASLCAADAKGVTPKRLAVALSGQQVRLSAPLNGYALNESSFWTPYVATSEAACQTRILKTNLVYAEPKSAGCAESWAFPNVTQLMFPRAANARAYIYAHNSSINILRVRAIYYTSSTIARAKARATANTILAYSYPSAYAVANSNNLIARNSKRSIAIGQAILNLEIAVSHDAITIANGKAIAETSHNITHDLVTYKYISSNIVASAEASKVDPNRWPVRSGLAPCYAEQKVSYMVNRNFKGVARSKADALAKQRANQWIDFGSKSTAYASTSIIEEVVFKKYFADVDANANAIAKPWHWAAKNAKSKANAYAIESAEFHRTAPMLTDTQAVAEMSGSPVRFIKVNPRIAIGEGEIRADAKFITLKYNISKSTARSNAIASLGIIFTQHPSKAASDAVATAEASNKKVSATPAAAFAQASGGKAFFKTNASAPAPTKRTVLVPYYDRSITIPHTSREYLVR